MTRWYLLLSVLMVACTYAQTSPALNTTATNNSPQAQFYLVASRPVKLNLTTCNPASPPTCALNDLEASYVVQRAVQRSGHVHTLMDGRTVRTEFALQVAAGQLSAAEGRRAALDLSAAILANTTSALLGRPLSLHEMKLAGVAIARNVPRCVQLNESTLRDMWAAFVYREAQQANFTASDPIGQFAVSAVLFLAQVDKPASRPDPLQFAQFVRARLSQLVGNMCSTEAPAPLTVSPQLVPLPNRRQVIQLVTVWRNGTVTVKEVAPSQVVKGVPFAPNGDGALMITPTSG